MFAHGIVSGLLFMAAGTVHHSTGSRDISHLGGMTPRAPVLATTIMIGSLASLGLPALISFPAEFAALQATWSGIGYWVLVPLLTLVVTAGFYLWMMQRMLFGPQRGLPEKVEDVPRHEGMAMGILIALTVVYGLLPFLLVNLIVNSPVNGIPIP
jgi:NADH-quinone oxidoreductase subunit M